MYRTFVLTLLLSYAVMPQLAFGQQKGKTVPPVSTKTPPHDNHDHSHAGDNHDHKGPHDGELLEIGEEEYHAELVISEKKNQIEVYLLDASAENAVQIDAPFLAVNTKFHGKPTQFKLKPVPQKDDKSGQSSCFSLTSVDLIHALHEKNSDAKLAIKISKKSYVLKINHEHDHANHAKAPTAVKR